MAFDYAKFLAENELTATSRLRKRFLKEEESDKLSQLVAKKDEILAKYKSGELSLDQYRTAIGNIPQQIKNLRADAEVEQRLMDSITYAKEDIATRALVEAKTEAEQILSVTEKFMSKNVSLLTKDELMQTAEAMQALQLAITMEDKNLIQGKTEALNELTRPFAERVMDQAISGALKGKGIMD
jgi:hypothetical protein